MIEPPVHPNAPRTFGALSTRAVNALLYAVSTYAVPLLIALVSVLAWLSWDTQYPVGQVRQLSFQSLPSTPALTQPQAAWAQLSSRPATAFTDTQLSPHPFWMALQVPAPLADMPWVVEFASRHAVSLTCWNAATFESLGTSSRDASSGAISLVKGGFALKVPPNATQVLCRTAALGPARLSALLWTAADLQSSTLEFHRKSGLLDGGILMLALFVLLTALINRSSLYILFAAWLVINLRMGALSAGWDTQWLGLIVPFDILSASRPLTLALYYTLTLTLFTTLFKEELKHIGYRGLVTAAQWSCLPLLALALLSSYGVFLPVMWLTSGLGIAMLTFLMGHILRHSSSRVALFYSSAIAVTLLSSLYEVAAAALGLQGMIGAVNSITAALSSSLLAALAIAEQMRQEHEQHQAVRAELTHTYEVLPIGLFSLDLNGRFLTANPALLDMLGPDVLSDGKNHWQNYFNSADFQHLLHMAQSLEKKEMEVKGRKLPGLTGSKRFLIQATLARDKIEGSLQDVTEKSRATEYLQFLANHDSLTKVLNRRGIEAELTAAIEALQSLTPSTLAVAYLDLDRFKLINDLFGHGTGDHVLEQVSLRVLDLLSPEHQVGRVGGDEFVIVFRGTHIRQAGAICQGIVDSIGKHPYRVGDKAFYVRASLGLIEAGAHMKFNDILSVADRACREAKVARGDALVVYEQHAPAFEKHDTDLKIIALLSTSAATDGLYLEMQPIMSLSSPHESLNFEVLLRMRDPQGQIIRTDMLIHAAESSGRMGMIDRWVLSTTLAWLDTHYAQLKHTKFVCVNLSGASLNDEKFLQDVFALFDLNPHLVRHLCLEVTESVALHDLANTRRFVERIRGYGAKVALDDFGAGYTSFSYLKEFTADLLKIDGSFIVNMNRHPANIAIVEAIVNLAKNLGMKVIAEWAEDQATVKTLVDIGVDYVQGFAVARSQSPHLLLNAPSSASFIQDPELAKYVRLLGPSDPLIPVSPTHASTEFVNIKLH